MRVPGDQWRTDIQVKGLDVDAGRKKYSISPRSDFYFLQSWSFGKGGNDTAYCKGIARGSAELIVPP